MKPEVRLEGLITELMVENSAGQDDAIEGCKRRDPAAQYRLFQTHKDRVYAIALFLCKHSADAAEITQEVFLKVFSKIEQFRGESKFETWLYRIVANTARDHARRSRHFLWIESKFWCDRQESKIYTASSETDSRTEDLVRTAIASLPEKLRVPVVLRYIEDLSYDEISAVLKCPPGTVAARLARAHKILATKLARLKARR
jgi:RNA polymerase sigma-70 factor, ECF subfamily